MGNIRRNGEKFRALTGKKLCAVVKADAYGHGAAEVVNALGGVADCFAVALLDEAIAIRGAACGKEILVFTPPLTEEEVLCAAWNGFVLTVPDLFTARLISGACAKYRLPIKVHLKLNTGMNRYGMNASMLGKVCKYLQRDPFVRVEGVYSHLYACERSVAEAQRALFVKMQAVCARYFPVYTAHLSATYGALLGEAFSFDMVRVGIGLYGYLPVERVDGRNGVAQLPKLERGMTVRAVTVASRKYSFGGAGYGRPFSGTEGAAIKRLSVCRVGYADGFLRKKENGMQGDERNANNLCMDVCIRNDGSARGKSVILMQDADETARRTGTISYEVLCAATRRAEFVYDNE